jgi:homoserine kinase type II
VRVATAGFNNRSWAITTPAATYYLRCYAPTTPLAQIRYEHQVLKALAGVDLPFAVPTPLPAADGSTSVVIAMAERSIWAALFPAIPGAPFTAAQPPAVLDACGTALAQLDQGLARIGPLLDEGTDGRLAPYAQCLHDPDVEQLPALLTAHGLAAARAHRLEAFLRALREESAERLPDLPRQVIHNDFTRGNVLLKEGRVRGVLDFEFAQHEYRAFDVAIALFHLVLNGRWRADSPRDRWARIIALVQGYVSVQPLSEAEIAALPTLLRLRLVGVWNHWSARWRAGLATVAVPMEHADWVLTTDRWLRANNSQLVERITAAAG